MIEIFVYFDRKKIQGISFISHAYQMMNEEKEKEKERNPSIADSESIHLKEKRSELGVISFFFVLFTGLFDNRNSQLIQYFSLFSHYFIPYLRNQY